MPNDNAIICYWMYEGIAGTFITCLDYFIFIKNVRLILVTKYPKMVLSVLKARYGHVPDNIIILENRKKLLWYTGTTALIHYDHYTKCDSIYLAGFKNIICFGSYSETYENVRVGKNVEFFSEYTDNPYIKKINFRDLKISNDIEDNTFIHINMKFMLGNAGVDYILSKVKGYKNVISYISKDTPNSIVDKLLESGCFKYISRTPIHDILNLFTTYLYVNFNTFDYSPRLMIESAYLGRKIHYINDFNLQDGSFIRYNECLNGDINKYNMTEDDIIVRRLTNGT